MTNHPNRSRLNNPAANPTTEDIKIARNNAGLTQTQAGILVHSGVRTWQKWELGERRMHPAIRELFKLKIADTREEDS